MNKKTVIMVCCTLGMTIGGGVSWILGERALVGVWPVAGLFAGGMLGIWVGVKLSK